MSQVPGGEELLLDCSKTGAEEDGNVAEDEREDAEKVAKETLEDSRSSQSRSKRT
jgi:hypothetical protein